MRVNHWFSVDFGNVDRLERVAMQVCDDGGQRWAGVHLLGSQFDEFGLRSSPLLVGVHVDQYGGVLRVHRVRETMCKRFSQKSRSPALTSFVVNRPHPRDDFLTATGAADEASLPLRRTF